MAYAKDIEDKCMTGGCGKRATKEVFNKINAPCGKFCADHAKMRVAAIK
jgi:hypothetical protein